MKCLTWTLIAGSNWVFLSWLASLLLGLALLAIGLGGLWLASKMKRIALKKTVLRVKPVNVITEQMAGLKRNSKYVGLLVGGLVIGLVLGWSLHAAKQFQHTYVLNDVKVLRRDGPDQYLMQTAWGQAFEIKFCSDYLPQFPEHVILKNLVYEDRQNCKSIADKQLGYLLKRDERGQLIKFNQGE